MSLSERVLGRTTAEEVKHPISGMVIVKRNQLIDPFITVSMAKIFEKIFRESLVIELAWEEIIEYKIDNQIRQENFKKISFMKLIKKYFSKKIRSLFK